MSGPLVFDAVLCLLLVGVALGAVLVRDVFAAIAFFIAYGLFMAVAWVRLGALDVALAEAAIGAGLTGVLLMRAAARLHPADPAPLPPLGWGRRALAALLCLALFAALAQVVLLPPTGAGLAGAVDERLAATGVGNPVTAVLLNFRGYDTLLETVVLLAALVGAWSLCADSQWTARPGLPDHARAQGLLDSFARVLPPIGALVGLHLFWAGAQAPGGAFQAGTILAAVWLLAAMAGRARPPAATHAGLRLLVVAGPAVFLLLALAAVPFGGFLVFPPALAKALVLSVEAALTASIAATLGLLVIGPPSRPQAGMGGTGT